MIILYQKLLIQVTILLQGYKIILQDRKESELHDNGFVKDIIKHLNCILDQLCFRSEDLGIGEKIWN